MQELTERRKQFDFNGRQYEIRAFHDGCKCIVNVFNNGRKVNRDPYYCDLDSVDIISDQAESDVRNNLNQ